MTSAAPVTPFAPGDPLPPTLLVGAAARCLLDEQLSALLAPVAKEAEVVRIPAAALAKEKEESSLANVVLGHLSSASLFGARRVIVVLGGQELLRDKQVQAWIEKPTPRTSLVFAVVRAPRDGLPAVPAELAVVTLWEPGPQGPAELRRFLERRATLRKAKITPSALDALVAQAGSSLDALDSELEKLSLYRLGETIDASHVEALSGHTAGRDFDRLWQALLAARPGDALALLETMGEEGLLLFGGGRLHGRAAIAGALLPMLLARIRRVAAVCVSGEKLVAAVGDALRMKPGYVRFLQQDGRALGSRLPRWQAAAVAAEVAQKRVGLRSDEELLERLLLELARNR